MPARISGLRALLVLAVVSGGLVAVAAPAEAAPASLKLSRTTAIAHESVTVTVTAGQKLKRPVRLQYREGSAWRTWRKGTTSASGAKKFTVSTTRSSIVVRAVFPKARVKGVTRAVRTSRTATLRTVRQAVGLQVAKDAATRTASATVTVTPARTGRKVSLQRRESDGTWRTIVSGGASDARGRATFSRFATDLQAAGRQYRAVLWALGKVPSLSSATATVSWPITVQVDEPGSTGEGGDTVLSATTTGPVSSVRFYVDGQEVGRDASAPWQYAWSPVRGRHDLTARAIGPAGTELSEVIEFDQAGTDSDITTGLPAGFSIDTLQAGFDLPTSMAVTDGGRVFVAEKSGRVLTFERSPDGANSATEVVADLSDHVAIEGDRGMTGLAVDPQFGEASGDHDRIYVSYVLRQESAPDYEQAQQVQAIDVSGWSSGDEPLDYDAGSVILGRVTDARCLAATGPFPDDCLPLVGQSHTVGDLVFDHDGNLLVGVGDGASFAAGLGGRSQSLRAQDPRVLSGKVLRIDPETGRGVEDNPYFGDPEYDGTQTSDFGTSNASRVAALGLRNPFRISAREDGTILIGDVGESMWEELDVLEHDHHAEAPVNFGWPCYEGSGRTAGVEDLVSTGAEPDVETNPWDQCRLLWAQGADAVADPAYTYKHLGGASVTGGVFYTGGVYPQDYRNSFFFGDYAQDFVRTARVDDLAQVSDVETFAPAGVAGGPVKFLQGPDGRIWYLSIYDGSIRVIDYVAPTAVAKCPVGTFSRTFHDLTDSSLANDPASYPEKWSWLRFADATFPVATVGPRECVNTIDLQGAAGELPEAGLPSQRYGVRWQGRVRLSGGTYEFAASGQDWVRLWVDDDPKFEWFASPFFGQQRSTVKLAAGIHTIRYELVHDDGAVSGALGWAQTGTLPTVSLTAPRNGIVLPTTTVNGDRHGTLDFAVKAEPGDAELESVTVTADLLHVTGQDQHAHPVETRTFDGGDLTRALSGSFDVDDGHARGNSVFRLRARVVDASGASRTSAPVYVCLTGNAVGICGSS